MKKKIIITIALMLIVFYGIGITVKLIKDYKSLSYSSDILVSTKDLVNKEGNALEGLKDYCVEYMEINKTNIARKIFYGNCSKNKPMYCENGKLVDNCAVCGCEAGESCSDAGECVNQNQNDFSLGGAGGAAAGGPSVEDKNAAGGGAAGGAGGGQSSGCTDSDVSTTPNPIYESGYCSDTSASYNDACEDPISGAASTIWVKEYKCQGSGNISICVGVYKNCPTSSQTYFGDSNSQCSSNKCSTPSIQQNFTINATCFDAIINQDETNTDCGGVCGGYFYDGSCHQSPQIINNATCFDAIMNQDETNTDCGGVCGGYWYSNSCHQSPQIINNATCSDGIKNQNEIEIDCGGVCAACQNNGGGQNQNNDCYVSPAETSGLTIFTVSICHDLSGEYQNSCTSPVYGDDSNVFIKTYVCVDNKCSSKYYSCPIKGKEIFNIEGYKCFNNKCTP